MEPLDPIMTELTGLPWAQAKAALLLGAGAFLLVLGVATAISLRHISGPSRNIRRLQRLGAGFRFFVVGVCLFGVGLSWTLDVGWLYTFALVFGLEELWEASFLSSFLRQARQTEERHRAQLARDRDDAAAAEWDRRAGRVSA